MGKYNLKCKTCQICGREFCSKNPNTQLSQHLRWCTLKHEFLNKYNLDSRKIEEEYYNTGSVLSFKEKYPFWDNFLHYYKLFKELNISVSLKKSHNNQKTKDKRTKTFIEKYGYAHNFLKDTPSRKKWEKRLYEEEGITNVFQREEVKEKIKESILEKYGTEKWKNDLTSRGNNIISKLNKKVFNILNKLNIEFDIELKLKKENGYYYAYDIILENNKIIEVNGDYWHGNPDIYKADDLILKNTSAEILVKDKWLYDLDKIKHAEKLGYKVLVIWENDIKNDLKNVIETIKDYAKS